MPLTYFRPRGDIKSNWELANPILKLREMGLEWETTVGVGRAKVKFGDGTSAWNSLDYAIDVESTIQSDTKSNWTLNNPVLQSGQIGLEWETTVGVGEINIKVGDGATAWNSLGYGFTYDITNKEIKTITEYSGSEENPKLEDGDTLSEVAGKLNKQNDFLKSTLGYERLDAMAETLGGLSNEDFMGVMEKLNSLKFNKSDVYNGTDSTSTTLAASANALKTVKDLADSNASDIAELNSDFRIKTYKSPSDLGLQVGSNLHIADVFQAMPYNSIFQCRCEGENTFSFSDYPVSPNGSPIGFGILTINRGEGNRNSITFSQSLSAGTHDLWINSCTYTGDESTLGSWDKAVTNADLPLSAKTYQLGGNQELSFSYAGGNASCLIFAVRDSNAGIYLCDNWNYVVTAKDFANLNVSVSNKTVTIQNNNANMAISIIVLIANNMPLTQA